MEKIKGKHLKSTIIFLFLFCTTTAQSKSGMENYNMISSEKKYTWMPVIHYQSVKGFYSELRYNYEDEKTGSAYFGKKLFGGRKKEIELVPMIGFSIGQFSGASIAFKTNIETEKFFMSTESQYSAGFKKTQTNFFFNWSEAGFNVGEKLFTGAALQATIEYHTNEIHPGIMIGYTSGRITIPVYLFKPFTADKWLQIGINYEHSLNRKRYKISNPIYLQGLK